MSEKSAEKTSAKQSASSDDQSKPKVASAAKVVQLDAHHADPVMPGSDEAHELGYWGVRETPFADEEFALTTGPDAPVTDLAGRPLEFDGDHIQKAPPE